jgi:hypothetical protein
MVRTPRVVTQAAEVRKMLKALDLQPGHEALIAMALGLAAAVDKDPANAALWRELRAAVTTLREATSDSSDEDSTQFLLSIKTPRVQPTMGDT